MLGAIRNLFVLGLIVWGAWALWNWKFGAAGGGEMEKAASQSCIEEARSRYDITGASAHSVQANTNGFVVKGTMTLSRGGNAKLTCLTNHNGRVTQVMVEER